MHSLLDAARRGDTSARERLSEMFAVELHAYVERRAGPRVRRFCSIADLCQDVLIEVFRGFDSLPEDADLSTFKGRLFKNAQWIISRRARKAGEFHGASAHDGGTIPDGRRDETGRLARADEFDRIRALADRLDAKYGEVILLRADGLAFDEIARRLDRKEVTVRKQYLRAVEALRALLRR